MGFKVTKINNIPKTTSLNSGLRVAADRDNEDYRFDLGAINPSISNLKFTEAQTTGNSHLGLGSAFFEFPDGSLGLITRTASSHGLDTSGKLVLYKSTDGGLNFNSDPTTVIDSASVDDRDFSFAIMDSDRVGLVVTRPTHANSVFVYSDNNGTTWNSVNITTLTGYFYSIGSIIRYPTVAGGDDDGGWITYGYYPSDTDKIYYAYTLDNGATWSTGIALTGVDGFDGVEPTVCRVGTYEKWLMVMRDNVNTNGFAYASISTDMITWSAPFALGFNMGKNPPYITYDSESDLICLFAAMRKTLTYEKWVNKLVLVTATPDLINGADYSELSNDNVKAIGSFRNLLGYFSLVKRQDGGYLGSLAYNEEPVQFGSAETSRIALVSNIDSKQNKKYRKRTDGNGKTWTSRLITDEKIKKITGYDINVAYSTSTSLQADITFPETLPSYDNIEILMAVTGNSFSNPTGTNIGMIRVDNITTTGCRIIATCSLGSFAPGDYIRLTVSVEAYLSD